MLRSSPRAEGQGGSAITLLRIIVLAVAAFPALSASVAAKTPLQPLSVLVVLAHPDDETLFGPALARLAREGSAIRIVYVADGRYGVRAHSGLQGDALVAARQEEARCASAAHGAGEPVFLGFSDQLVGSGHIRDQLAVLEAARAAIGEEIERFGPDIVITFSPGGDTGHPDHRLVGDLTTEVMLSRHRDGTRLFQAGWAQSANSLYVAAGLDFSAFPDEAFDVAFAHTAADETAAAQALRCYSSQFTPEEIDGFVALEKADQSNARWFREVPLATKQRQKF
jgi:N-acetylglucosamine malate deacetylase 2